MSENSTPAPAEKPPIPAKVVRSWALWDWATQPFNSVILTFVWVSLYLVSDSFLPTDVAAQNADGSLVCSRTADAATEYCRGLSDLSANYGWVAFWAGILVLVLAPVLGQQADARARQYLARQMENHFFGSGADAAAGYVPPSA